MFQRILQREIEKSYVENFGDDLPLAENLIDTKALKANAQRRKEKHLEKQVELLKNELDEIKSESSLEPENENTISPKDLDDINEESNESEISSIDEPENVSSEKDNDANLNHNDESNYDIILQVKPEKVPQIKSQIIDGEKCIVIPMKETEQATVNGLDNLL